LMWYSLTIGPFSGKVYRASCPSGREFHLLKRPTSRLRLRRGRHVIPRAPLELPARALLEDAAPLLEEERHAGGPALIANRRHPRRVHRPACSKYQDETIRNVRSRRVQCDEIWSFVGAKAKNASDEKKLHFACAAFKRRAALEDIYAT